MKVSDAVTLLRTPLIDWTKPQSWCELGSGSGTFTRALAELLVPGSSIDAVDIDQRGLSEIPDQWNEVDVRKIHGDIASPSLRFTKVDGILMANSLHFIRDQHSLLGRLSSVADRFLIVEYERSRPHRSGPFPVSFEKLQGLFSEIGITNVQKVATRQSRFGGTMYSAYVEK